jgi:hypothetical protein
MSDRERWIVYPLLFLAIGLGLKSRLSALDSEHEMQQRLTAQLTKRVADHLADQVITNKILLTERVDSPQGYMLDVAWVNQLEDRLQKATALYQRLNAALNIKLPATEPESKPKQ